MTDTPAPSRAPEQIARDLVAERLENDAPWCMTMPAGQVCYESGLNIADWCLPCVRVKAAALLRSAPPATTPKTQRGHIDPDCEVARGVGAYCTCQTPEEKAEDARERAQCEAERDRESLCASAPPPGWREQMRAEIEKLALRYVSAEGEEFVSLNAVLSRLAAQPAGTPKACAFCGSTFPNGGRLSDDERTLICGTCVALASHRDSA